MSTNITTLLWVPGALSVEAFADALVRAGFEEKSGDRSPERIAAAQEPVGAALHFPGLYLPASRVEPGVALQQLPAGGPTASVVRLDLAGRGALPMPPSDGCNVETLAYEIAVARLFEAIGATYGYMDWESNIHILGDSALHQRDIGRGYAFEWAACLKNRILQLHPISYFSDPFLKSLPALESYVPWFRAVRIGEYGWQLALTRCLIWGNPEREEELTRAASIDGCWRKTRSLETHAPGCPASDRA